MNRMGLRESRHFDFTEEPDSEYLNGCAVQTFPL